jgi:FtsH-binding integral membrane protein
MRKLLRTVWRLTAAAVLVFLALAVVQSMLRFPWAFDRRRVVLPLAVGFGSGLLFFLLVSRFLVLYVFGHELTHWLAAKLFLRRTGAFQVRGARGSVAIDRPNIWIVLAPYFIPVYSLILLGAYGVTDFFWRAQPHWLVPAVVAGVGVTYAFHVRLTAFALRRQQSDLQAHGRMLSLALIVLCNFLLIFFFCMISTWQWRAPATLLTGQIRSNAELVVTGARMTGDWLAGMAEAARR